MPTSFEEEQKIIHINPINIQISLTQAFAFPHEVYHSGKSLHPSTSSVGKMGLRNICGSDGLFAEQDIEILIVARAVVHHEEGIRIHRVRLAHHVPTEGDLGLGRDWGTTTRAQLNGHASVLFQGETKAAGDVSFDEVAGGVGVHQGDVIVYEVRRHVY